MSEKLLDDKLGKLKLVLDETMAFPSDYVFKFIVPTTEVHHLLAIVEVIEGVQVERRPSQNGNYISVTIKIIVQESEEIVTVYRQVSRVRGIISL